MCRLSKKNVFKIYDGLALLSAMGKVSIIDQRRKTPINLRDAGFILDEKTSNIEIHLNIVNKRRNP